MQRGHARRVAEGFHAYVRQMASVLRAVGREGAGAPREPPADEISVDTLRRYVAYARAKCAPRLNMAAMETLQNYYVSVRQSLNQQDVDAKERGSGERTAPPPSSPLRQGT